MNFFFLFFSSWYFSFTRTKNLFVVCRNYFKIQFDFMKSIFFCFVFLSYLSSIRTKICLFCAGTISRYNMVLWNAFVLFFSSYFSSIRTKIYFSCAGTIARYNLVLWKAFVLFFFIIFPIYQSPHWIILYLWCQVHKLLVTRIHFSMMPKLSSYPLNPTSIVNSFVISLSPSSP